MSHIITNVHPVLFCDPDCGMSTISRCAKDTIAKLDKTQYEALGKSTPTNVLLARTGKLLLHRRRILLAYKFMAKDMGNEKTAFGN